MARFLSAGILLEVSRTYITSADTVDLPSSCLGADDGYQWMKMLDGDEYPAVHQLCDNEYMVIDINEDSNVVDYFSSYAVWHSALGGAGNGNLLNWEEWWLPSGKYLDGQTEGDSEYFKFVISEDCSSCALEQNTKLNYMSSLNTDAYGDRTAYYMTGPLFGCLSVEKAKKDCMWNTDTYECSLCDYTSSDQDLGYHVMWQDDEDWDSVAGTDLAPVGLCGVYPQGSYDSDNVPSSRDSCVGYGRPLQPSIGNKGRFCVCVQPNESFDKGTTFSVSTDQLDSAKLKYQEQHVVSEEEDTSTIDDVHELYQSDFVSGTYRIRKSGTYQIMEDIVFDFNADDDWWPRADQEEYPGAETARDEYMLGFIAGITVEADDVVIDLNGHEIKQSLAFYHQQRFFSCIALKSVVFPLNQGPGLFGTNPVYPSNVVIQNGNIGLSSHHGIHGHYNEDVTIENVHIYDFETHGVQLSYFKNLKMKNVEIGPSSTVAFMKGEYAYARWTIQRLTRIIESDYNETAFPLTFNGRSESVTLQDIIDNLQNLVDIAFSVVMGTEEYDDDDDDYITAKELFINEDGLPYGAVMYGLFLNSWWTNVFQIHPTLRHSEHAQIENLKIHGLHHTMAEYLRMDSPVNSLYQNMWGAAFDARACLGDQIEAGQDIDWTKVEYVGNPMTDAYIALGMATTDWGEMGMFYADGFAFGQYDGFGRWTLGLHSFTNFTHPYLGCNNDRMTHVPKGVIGMRIDGVDDLNFENLEIYDLFEGSGMGSELCGEYWEANDQPFSGGGHFLQNDPYYYGYTGNRVHGMYTDWTNITVSGVFEIHDLRSKTGLVRGIGMYTESKLTIEDDTSFSISDLTAGSALSDVDTESLPHPYAPAEAKPIHLLDVFTDDIAGSFYSEIVGDPKFTTPSVQCVFGRDGVNQSDWAVSFVHAENCADEGLFAQSVRVLSVSSMRYFHVRMLAVVVVAMTVLLAVWIRLHKSSKKLKQSEMEPLLQ